ncbi:uncharacterized protein KY384_008411 [Bacidia gigantensis]|uniref:uncharacterized protein n=1 Tax=Bacidia gigantensis TaxID=2732470 RepID=UPI001D043B7C|nr:uncharacterized protein KY384_008411 [Bacidia gigantensis]KAG8526982.1 hypothetical protein KY384_008411 [Bacidia gigantensis]
MGKAPSQGTRHHARTAPYPTATPTPTTPYEPRTPPLTIDDKPTNSAWLPKNDSLLQQLRSQGHNWQSIASNHFPDKTPNACRKRYERLMERKTAADSWDHSKMEALGKAYLEVREEMWTLLANRVNEKWQTVESKVRLQTIPVVSLETDID